MKLHLSRLSIIFGAALAAGCSNDKTSPGPTGDDGRVTINSDGDDLADNVEAKDEPVDVQPAGMRNAVVYVPDPVYSLTLVAEVAPPVVDGELLQATSVSFDGERAAVSYNTAGDTHAGAVDIFQFDKDGHPNLVSRATFEGTDVNAVTAGAGRLWLATSTTDEAFDTPAVLEGLTVLWNGQLSLDNHVRVGLSSHAATSVAVGDGLVYATSGAEGGVFAFDPKNEAFIAQESLSDARWVTYPGNGTVVTVAGVPGRLSVKDEENLAAIGDYTFNGASVPEAKSTVQVFGGKAFIAGGPGGTVILDLATGDQLAQIPVPTGLPLAQSEVVTNAVTVDEDLLFVSNGAAGAYMVVADGSLAADPKLGMPRLTVAGRLLFDGEIASVNHITYKNGFLFVATGRGGLKIVRADRLVPEVVEPTGFPYVSGFTTESERAGWTFSGSWGWGGPDGERQGVSGPFMDNDPAQSGSASGDAELGVNLEIPDKSASAIMLSYGASFVDASDKVELQVLADDGGWKTVATFAAEHQREGQSSRVVGLDDYRGKTIRVRFHQVMGPSAGVRRFTVDDFAVAPLELPSVDFPYVSGFDSEADQAVWSFEGPWAWSDDAFEGDVALDANPEAAPQPSRDDSQVAEMRAFVPVPPTGSPVVELRYRSYGLEAGDRVFLDIQEEGSASWVRLADFSAFRNVDEWSFHQSAIDDYRGKNVRLRFGLAYGKGTGVRTFVADSLRVGQMVVSDIAYPWSSDFEGATGEAAWVTENALARVQSSPDWAIEADPEAGAGAVGEARMVSYVAMPPLGPVAVSYRGKLQLLPGDQVFIESQNNDDPAWTAIATFGDEQNHSEWARFETPVEPRSQHLRFRFRVAFGPAVGQRQVTFDDFVVTGLTDEHFTYPYDAALDNQALSSWVVNGAWSATGDAVVANPDMAGPTTMVGHDLMMPAFVEVPSGGRPSMNVLIALELTDPNDALVLQVQSSDDSQWTTVRTYTSFHNRQEYGWDEISLDAWKGRSVRMRLCYRLGETGGGRWMSLAALRIEDLAVDTFTYPYKNNFESQAARQQWSSWGGWSASSVLDGNSGDVAQSGWDELQTATMSGEVPVPATYNAWLGFRHHLADFAAGDRLSVEIQPSDSAAWSSVAELTSEHVRGDWGAIEVPLDAFAGRGVRVRFALHMAASDAVRTINVDDVWVGPLSLITLEAPVSNEFSQPQSTQAWSLSGHWGWDGSALSSNPQGVDTASHATFQTARFNGFVDVTKVVSPTLKVSYKLDLKDIADRAYIEVLQPGSTQWIQLAALKVANNSTVPVQGSWSLSGLTKVSVRFRVVSAASAGVRTFAVSSVTIGQGL